MINFFKSFKILLKEKGIDKELNMFIVYNGSIYDTLMTELNKENLNKALNARIRNDFYITVIRMVGDDNRTLDFIYKIDFKEVLYKLRTIKINNIIKNIK